MKDGRRKGEVEAAMGRSGEGAIRTWGNGDREIRLDEDSRGR